jgi:hypothetical protein
MRKFNLENTIVSKLDLHEIEELIEYLININIRDCVTFISHVMDNEYMLSKPSLNDFKIQRFLNNEKFKDLRKHVINSHVITEKEWLELEIIHRKKLRKKKLINIMNKY